MTKRKLGKIENMREREKKDGKIREKKSLIKKLEIERKIRNKERVREKNQK